MINVPIRRRNDEHPSDLNRPDSGHHGHFPSMLRKPKRKPQQEDPPDAKRRRPGRPHKEIRDKAARCLIRLFVKSRVKLAWVYKAFGEAEDLEYVTFLPQDST